MNVLHITKDDMKNGPGIRVVCWVSGCNHNCTGCHNPETHDPNNGHPYNKNDRDYIFYNLGKNYVDGITFSGGDPLFESNLSDIGNLILDIRREFKESKSIWIYTGWIFEDFMNKYVLTGKFPMEIFKYIDVIVDGPYVGTPEYTVPTPLFRGSSNQRIINVKKTLDEGHVVEITESELWRN